MNSGFKQNGHLVILMEACLHLVRNLDIKG